MKSNLNYHFCLLESFFQKLYDLCMSDIFFELVLSNNEKK